jgi:hypothetical protein
MPESQLEDLVFQAIKSGKSTPAELIDAVKGASREAILEAVWRLADMGEVDFTSQRKIVAKKRLHAA